MNLNKNETIFLIPKTLLALCFHLLVLYSIYQLFVFSGFTIKTDIYFFRQWDAYWYASIAEHGYQYTTLKPSNSGFFPLFAYEWKVLWKLFDAGIPGVCLFNTLLFFAGMLLLKKAFEFSWTYFLLFISIPSNMFMYVPYTEATFFFLTAVILAGFKKNNQYMIFFGLVFASLTRPTAAFFIPAIVIMEVLAFHNFKSFAKRILFYSSAPLIGILIVILMQYKATGVWFAYFKSQSLFWKHTLQLPEFPLTTWGGARILWLDAFALFFGLLAAGLLIGLFIKKLRDKSSAAVEKSTSFSLGYLFIALASILLFNDKDQTGGTTLMGINRYILANPCFTLLLILLSTEKILQKKNWLLYVALALAVVFLISTEGMSFSLFNEWEKTYYLILIFLNILLYLFISKRFNDKFVPLIYLINSVIQIMLLHWFSYSVWIG